MRIFKGQIYPVLILTSANLTGANLAAANLEGANIGKNNDQATNALKTASKFLIPGAGLITGLTGLAGSEDSSGMNDLPAAQANLEKVLREALADLNEAESYFAEARGDAEAAAANMNRAETLRGKDEVDIKEAMEATASSRAKGAEFEAGAGELSAASRALYAKGLLPYAKGISNTAKASKLAQVWLQAAQTEISSIRNPMKVVKLRKTFKGCISLARALPQFFKTLGTSTKGVFAFSKAQILDTKKHNKPFRKMILNNKFFYVYRLISMCLVMSVGLPLTSAGIDYVSVETEGRGVSLKEAIDKALI